MSPTILYTVHDATRPLNFGPIPTSIAHVCNNLGQWGSGFVLAINKAFGLGPRESYRAYIKLCKENGHFPLGDIDEYQVSPNTLILNMIAQDNKREAPPYIDYNALYDCMRNIEIPIIQIPAIGIGIGRGEWKEVSKAIRRGFPRYGCVVVCCLDWKTVAKLKEEDEGYPSQQSDNWKDFLWHYNLGLPL